MCFGCILGVFFLGCILGVFFFGCILGVFFLGCILGVFFFGCILGVFFLGCILGVFFLAMYFSHQNLAPGRPIVCCKMSGNISFTLPATNSLHLKMDGWNTIVSFWSKRPIVRMAIVNQPPLQTYPRQK